MQAVQALTDAGRDQLVLKLREPEAYPLFVTGAGISLASGIPTFRGTDPEAVWARDVLELGTDRFFRKNPTKSWLWYLQRFETCLGAEPNPGHRALVDIEEALEGRSMVVTQNIDGLHFKAGTKNLVEVHGSSRKVRCSRRGCMNGAPNGTLDWDAETFAKFLAEPVHANLPRCSRCRKLLRAHVLWFDEGYKDHKDYGLDRALKVFDDATVVVFVGTSFAVTITDIIMETAWNLGLSMYSVDPRGETKEGMLIPINERAEEFLPWLADQVRVSR